jgi:hypothetical protein
MHQTKMEALLPHLDSPRVLLQNEAEPMRQIHLEKEG